MQLGEVSLSVHSSVADLQDRPFSSRTAFEKWPEVFQNILIQNACTTARDVSHDFATECEDHAHGLRSGGSYLLSFVFAERLRILPYENASNRSAPILPRSINIYNVDSIHLEKHLRGGAATEKENSDRPVMIGRPNLQRGSLHRLQDARFTRSRFSI